MKATVRVLLGDDHKIVREGLKMVLADDPGLLVVAEGRHRSRCAGHGAGPARPTRRGCGAA